MAFIDAVDEMERPRPAGSSADRQFAGHVGFAPGGEGPGFLVPHTHPAQVALGDCIGEVIDGVTRNTVNPLRTGLFEGIHHDLCNCLRHTVSLDWMNAPYHPGSGRYIPLPDAPRIVRLSMAMPGDASGARRGARLGLVRWRPAR